MVLRRTYQLSAETVSDLKQAGVRPAVITALESKSGASVYRNEEFLSVLAGIAPSPTPEEADFIRKYSRLSYLRLERIIPNRGVREWLDAAVFALVIALVVRTFLFAPFKIPSSSMVPTIQVGDHIFATMFSYGVPIPFTDDKLFPQPVSRGDIVIFPYPKDPSVDYIKRVVGLPGETLEVQGKTVLINGKPLDEPYAYYEPTREGIFGVKCDGLAFCGPLTIPPGHIFVMGDNRLDSADSRVWGFVDTRTIKGKGRIVYWSHDPREDLFSPDGYRLSRIGSLLR
jgi:signal peptidase I